MLDAQDMADMFGLETMANCTGVTERLAQSDGKWTLTRIFSYANGSTREEVPDERNWYVLPAAPGWHLLVIDASADAPTVERRPIAAWRYAQDKCGPSSLSPLRPGEEGYFGDRGSDMVSAVQSPDGQLIADPYNHDNPPFDDRVFASIEAWVQHARQRRAERLRKQAEEEAERARHRCPHCGADPIPW